MPAWVSGSKGAGRWGLLLKRNIFRGGLTGVPAGLQEPLLLTDLVLYLHGDFNGLQAMRACYNRLSARTNGQEEGLQLVFKRLILGNMELLNTEVLSK